MTESVRQLRDQRDHARRLIKSFTLLDPSLWPVLGEIDLVLSRTVKDNHGLARRLLRRLRRPTR